MKKRTISLLLIITLLLGLLTACGSEPQEDGSFVTPIDNDPVYLDPQIATDKGALSIINNCFEGLVRMNSDGKIISGVATEWSVSDDGLTYSFKLRKDAKWYVTKTAGKTIGEDYETTFDTALTADDFVFALRRAVGKSTNSDNADKLFCIKNAKAIHEGSVSASQLGVKKSGKRSLTIELEYPDSDFLTVLTTAIAMPCNKEFFEITAGRYGLSSSYLIYNGPFYISNWNEDTSVTIKKNSEYAGENTAKAASVFFSVNNEYETRAKKLSQETYDFSPLTYSQYSTISESNEISFSSSQDTLWGLVFNCKDEDMSNKALRLAICRGFDKSLMEKSEYMSGTAEGILPPSVMLSGKAYRDRAGEIKQIGYNSKKAGEYWETALSEIEKSGLSITIKCTREHENQLRAVLQNLQKTFGISCDVRVSALEEAQLISDIKSGDFQIAYAPITSESGFASDFLNNGVASITGYENSELTSLINSSQKGSNSQKTKSLKAAEELLISDAVILPVFFAESYYGMNTIAQGIYMSKANGALCFIDALKAG